MAFSEGPENGEQARGAMLWDMAGTLIPYDQETGRAMALPGCDTFLPELSRRFRHVVTTGDGTASARGMLGALEILPHLEAVFGDLSQPLGKPYGEILRNLGAEPGLSLAIGDRLGADIPADTDQVVTVLVNQGGDIINAGMVAYIVHLLQKQSAGDYPTAFRHLTINAMPDPAAEGKVAGGEITAAWRRNDGFAYRLWTFAHPALKGERLIIAITPS
jgi:hypothetical protein